MDLAVRKRGRKLGFRNSPPRPEANAFTHTEFRTLTRWWLGMDVFPEDRPCPADGCTLPLLKNGEHALLCKNGHGIILRHNALAQQFTSFCSRAFLAPQREKSLGNRGPGGALTRPADVFLPTASIAKGSLAQGMVLDFAVTHAQQTKYSDSVHNAELGDPRGLLLSTSRRPRRDSDKKQKKQDISSQRWWWNPLVPGARVR